jgi:flagellar assembly factor FliW
LSISEETDRRFTMNKKGKTKSLRLNTHLFGEIEVDRAKIITFQEGLIGFNNHKRYVILDDRKIKPFRWLQCVDEPLLAFIVVNPQVVKSDYTINIAKEKVSKLELSDPKEALVYTIVVLAKDPKDMTTNLRGPIIINRENRKGIQIVLDDDSYPTSLNIFEEVSRWVQEEEGITDAVKTGEAKKDPLVAANS